MGGLTRVWYILLFILIVGLFLYDNVWWIDYSINIGGIQKETQFFGKIINISKNHFYLYTGASNVKIESSNIPNVKEARYGESVVHILRRGDGTFIALGYHNYDYNYLLYFLSFIAFIIFLVIFLKEWKLTLRGFENA